MNPVEAAQFVRMARELDEMMQQVANVAYANGATAFPLMPKPKRKRSKVDSGDREVTE